MNDLEECQNELLDCQEEVRGKRIKITVGSQTVDAIIEETNNDFENFAGGTSDSGTYVAMLRISDFTTQPKETTQVTNPQTGQVRSIISVTVVNDSYRVTIGSLSAEASR